MESNGDTGKKHGTERSILKQVLLGILSNFSCIAPGMSLGFSAVALPALKQNLNSSQLSWLASVASLATPFGCFFAGPLADMYGRKPAIIIANITCLLGWIIIGLFCYLSNSYFWIVIIGRILTGLSTGLSGSPATVYMAEISTPKLRGIFTTWATVSFSLGVLVVYFLGFLLQGDLGALCLVTTIFPSIGILVTIFLIPESPTWLVGKNKIKEAESSLCKLFDKNHYSTEIQVELEMLIENKGIKNNKHAKKSAMYRIYRKISFLMQSHCSKPIGLVLTYFMFQQFSGIFVIIFYAIDIVNNAGITFDPYITIVIIAVVRLVSSVITSFLAKRFGRRPLSIFSGSGMTLCLLPLALYIKLKEYGTIRGENLSIIPLFLLLMYFVTSSIGFLPLPFALAAELFPTKVRGTAAGLISGIGYFFNFTAVKIYPNMVKYFGRSGVFCFYGAVAFIGTIFVVCLIPETKGKSLQEIEEYFGKEKKLEAEKRLQEAARKDVIKL